MATLLKNGLVLIELIELLSN